MFFFLSKIFAFLQSPLSWILIVAIAALFIRNLKWKKRLAILAGAMFFIFGNEPLVDILFRNWEIHPIRLKSIKTNYPLAVILCGVTNPGSQPDDRINISSSPDRVLHPVMLYKKGYINKILITGGSGRLFGAKKSEAGELKELLVMCGIPDSILITEELSRNTYENALFSKPIIEKLNIGNNFLLVTSAFHMRRSVAIFAKLGLHPQPFSVNGGGDGSGSIEIDKILFPSVFAYVKWQMLCHEAIGYLSYKISGYL
jgi:uncharacterized SAM-binding protein YcdF (DUF218 family)